MLKLFTGKKSGATAKLRDARSLYQKVMCQSRHPGFYAREMTPDSMTGRMEILCLHLAILHPALRSCGENGARLSQALYDVMVDDFDIALREEGLSDTAVKRRIKPMVKMFYDRGTQLKTAFESDECQDKLSQFVSNNITASPENKLKLVEYILEMQDNLKGKTLGQLALGQFDMPQI